MAKVMYYPYSSFQTVLRAYARKADAPVVFGIREVKGGKQYIANGPGVVFTGNSASPVIYARRENASKRCGYPLEARMAGVLRSV